MNDGNLWKRELKRTALLRKTFFWGSPSEIEVLRGKKEDCRIVWIAVKGGGESNHDFQGRELPEKQKSGNLTNHALRGGSTIAFFWENHSRWGGEHTKGGEGNIGVQKAWGSQSSEGRN